MRNVILSTAAALLVSAAVAGSPSSQAISPPQAKAHATPDPNELVCERQQALGSRLASHRICRTRAEWAEQRRIDRMDVEHVQMQRGCSDKC
jgi:invasion protein IalB